MPVFELAILRLDLVTAFLGTYKKLNENRAILKIENPLYIHMYKIQCKLYCRTLTRNSYVP